MKRLGSDPKLEDMMWASLTDALSKTPMGVTAENLAEKYNLTREEVDQFSLNSQQKWNAAQQAGNFADEMAPMEIKTKKVCSYSLVIVFLYKLKYNYIYIWIVVILKTYVTKHLIINILIVPQEWMMVDTLPTIEVTVMSII